MATLPEFRNNHAGSSLIQNAEQILQERQTNMLWCNGRITVTDYYKRLGFQEHGEILKLNQLAFIKFCIKDIRKAFLNTGKPFLYFNLLFYFFIYMYINKLGTKNKQT